MLQQIYVVIIYLSILNTDDVIYIAERFTRCCETDCCSEFVFDQNFEASAVKMEQQQRDIIHGYVRLNHKGIIPKEIIEMIYTFQIKDNKKIHIQCISSSNTHNG